MHIKASSRLIKVSLPFTGQQSLEVRYPYGMTEDERREQLYNRVYDLSTNDLPLPFSDVCCERPEP